MASAEPWRVARAASRGFSAGFGRTGRGAQPVEKSREGPTDAAGRQLGSRERAFPGEALVSDEGSGEPELPERKGEQPGPAISGLGVARAHGGPAEGLFEEAEAVLDRESQDIVAPEVGQIVGQVAADPGQPERGRRLDSAR